MRNVGSVSNSSFLERLNYLFDHFSELKIAHLTPARNNTQRVDLFYNKERNSPHFILEYSHSCLEVYGTEQVPSELVDALTQALPGAKYQQYNPRTHYWSGKMIDDYFSLNTKP